MAIVQTEVPDILYKGLKVYTLQDVVDTTSTPVTKPPVIVVPTPVTVPSVLAGRDIISTDLQWFNGNRIHSVKTLTSKNYWGIKFTPVSNTTARFVGAEDGGGPIFRSFIIYRVDTGEIVGTSSRPLSTVQARLAIDRDPQKTYFEIPVVSNVQYVLAITNNSLQASAMFMDLFLA